MKRTLYVTDLDGTLLNERSVVSDESRRLLNAAIESGVLLTIATARTPATVCPLMAGVRMQLPAIVMTGSATYDLRTGQYADIHYHSPQELEQLLTIYRQHELPTFIYSLRDNMIHVRHLGPLSPYERRFMEERLANPLKRFHVREDEPWVCEPDMEHTTLLFAMQPPENAEPVYRSIVEQGVACTPVFYIDYTCPEPSSLEVFAAGSSKAQAVERMAARLGVDEIVAFGDNVNDIPMLRVATRVVVPRNAIAQVKELADEVIEDHTTDAVARYIAKESVW